MPRILLYGNGVNLQFNPHLHTDNLFNQIILSDWSSQIFQTFNKWNISKTKLKRSYDSKKSWEENLEDYYKNMVCRINGFINKTNAKDEGFLRYVYIKQEWKKLTRTVIEENCKHYQFFDHQSLKNICKFFSENNSLQTTHYDCILTLNYELRFWEELTKIFHIQNNFFNEKPINLHGEFNEKKENDELYTTGFALFNEEKKKCVKEKLNDLERGDNYALDIVGVKLTNDHDTLKSAIKHFGVNKINYYGHDNKGSEPDKEFYENFKKSYKNTNIEFNFFNSIIEIWKEFDDLYYRRLKKRYWEDQKKMMP